MFRAETLLQRSFIEEGVKCLLRQLVKQEDQLMPTNLRDAFVGQSMSPNIVPFHMLHIVSFVQ